MSSSGWVDRAACRDADPEWFFPEQRSTDMWEQRALLVCARCEVRAECLKECLRNSDTREFGIWGGTTPAQRTRMRRRQREAGLLQVQVRVKSSPTEIE